MPRSCCVIAVCFLISHFLFWIGIYWYHVSSTSGNYVVQNSQPFHREQPQYEMETPPSLMLPGMKPERTSISSTTTTVTTTSTNTATSSTTSTSTTTSAAVTTSQTTNPPASKEIESYLEYIRFQDKERYWLNTLSSTNAELYYSYIPQIFCATKVRVGGLKDGGKWVCNPWHLKLDNCTVYSLGVGLNTLFDEEIAQKFRCNIFAFDPDELSGRKLKEKNIAKLQYFPFYIDGGVGQRRTKNHRTLRNIMLGLKNKKLDILKMDVEGAEFEIFDAYFDDFYNNPSFLPSICQILIEVHTWDIMKWMRLFKTFEKHGYLLYSREINLLGFGNKFGDKLAAEYSYIHKSCLDEYGLSNVVYFQNFPPQNFFTTALPPMPI